MRFINLITRFKDSLFVSACLGIILGFVLTKMIVSLHEDSEEIMSLGNIEDDQNNPAVSTATTNNNGTDQPSGTRIKILCMVITSLENDGRRARSVNSTWGKRCDKLIFLTSRNTDNLNTVLMPDYIQDNRDTLWEKVKFGFKHAYSSYYDFDWFLKADDDTYVVMENLKAFLNGYVTSEALYFGCRLNRKRDAINLEKWRKGEETEPAGYMSGGAGYIVSKEALRRLVELAFQERKCFLGDSWAEDINMGKCLESVDVKFMDTRDSFGRLRFLPLMPFDSGYLIPGKMEHDSWYFKRMYYRSDVGTESCAESAISFHYIADPYMNLIEFFLYHLSPHQN